MKQRNTWEVIGKYYLNERHNCIIICIIIYFNAIYLMKLIPSVEKMLTDTGTIFTVTGVSILAIIAYLGVRKQIKQKFCFDDNEKEKKAPFSVSRDTYLEKLTNGKGLFFVLGESGAGKSYLLGQLIEQLGDTASRDFIENNYFNCLQQISGAEYIIFDQFEQILDISEPSKMIKTIKKLNDGRRTIILSIRKEYFAEIYKMFEYHGKYLWVEYNAYEKTQIITQLYDLVGEENVFNILDDTFASNEQKVYSLYLNIKSNEIQIELTLLKQMIIDVIEDKILFIQLTYLGRILQQDNNGLQQAENDWKECRDYNILITHYIEKEIDDFIYSNVAYSILFLLCQDTKGIYANMEDDFANISIQSKEVIRSTLKYLEGLQLILRVKSHDNQRGMYIVQYEISHSYILDILFGLCNSKLDIGVRNNIMFYNREYQVKRIDYSVQKEFPKNSISKQREKYIDNNKFLFARLCIVLLIVIIANIRSIWFLNSSDYKNMCWRMFFTNITVTVSTYYIFNYYHYFMRIFGYKYWIGVGVAMSSVILSYWSPDYWAIGYGVAISVTGGIILRVSSETRMSEKSFFKDRFRNFFIIGLIVVVLGCYYHPYTHGDMKLAWPCYFLYSGYMLLGIMSHINKPYILALLGKVLYKDKEGEIK